MKNIQTEIIINGSTAEVWNVLMDHQEYPKWNPFIKEISGNSSEGNSIHVLIQTENNKAMEFKPLILKNEKEKEFRWLGNLYVKGLFDGEHYFKLEKMDDNKTRFIHGENFSGLISGLLLKMISKSTLEGFTSMNEALKGKVENN